MKSLRLPDAELKAQITPLMHADLIKERSEGGTMYKYLPKPAAGLKTHSGGFYPVLKAT